MEGLDERSSGPFCFYDMCDFAPGFEPKTSTIAPNENQERSGHEMQFNQQANRIGAGFDPCMRTHRKKRLCKRGRVVLFERRKSQHKRRHGAGAHLFADKCKR